jgi:hypothetical protein
VAGPPLLHPAKEYASELASRAKVSGFLRILGDRMVKS